jgi:peroxiredoxin
VKGDHIVQNHKQISVGEEVADFELMDTNGKIHRLSHYRGSIVLIVFWSAECPVSREYDSYFNALLSRYPGDEVVVLGVDSNVHYGEREIVEAVRERQIGFSVLRDADSAIADDFGALTTPHVFIVDADGRLVYEGAVDDRTFRQPEATISYVDQALAALLSDETPPVTQTQPYGCTIVRH